MGGFVFGFGVGVRTLIGEEEGKSSGSNSDDIGGVDGAGRGSRGDPWDSCSSMSVWRMFGEADAETAKGGGEDEIVMGSVVVPTVGGSW